MGKWLELAQKAVGDLSAIRQLLTELLEETRERR